MNPSTLLASTTLPLTAQRTVKRALSLLEKHLREPRILFTSTNTVRDWLRLQLAGLEREVFIVLYLDNQHRLLACETLFTGSIKSTEVYPREVVKATLRHNAVAVILAHNHPSGKTEPSQADRQITDRLVNALGLVEVKVLDHLIVGGLDIMSFAERGWLPC